MLDACADIEHVPGNVKYTIVNRYSIDLVAATLDYLHVEMQQETAQ